MVEQAHLDEAGAQSGTGFGEDLLSQAILLDQTSEPHLMTAHFVKVVGMLSFPHYFQSPALLHGPPFQRIRHPRRYEDQSGGLVSSSGSASLPVNFHPEFVASAKIDVVAVLLVA